MALASFRAQQGPQGGFSMIEILAAFAIATVSLTALMRVFSQGLTAADLTQDYTRATLIAQSRLAAAGVETPLDDANASGAEGKYQWTLIVQPYEPPPYQPPADSLLVPVASVPVQPIPQLEMRLVTARVVFPGTKFGQGREVVLQTYRTIAKPL